MIVGLGTDVVDVTRLGVMLERTPALRSRIFGEGERHLPLVSLAARVAAKEAAAKALGAPPGLSWLDAVVESDENGAPSLRVGGGLEVLARHRGVRSWHLSLSHDAGVAVAVVVAEG